MRLNNIRNQNGGVKMKRMMTAIITAILILTACSDQHTMPHFEDNVSNEADAVPGRAIDGFSNLQSCPVGQKNWFYQTYVC